MSTYRLHLIKVLLPSQLAQLGTLQLHVLGTGSLSVRLDLALDGRVERAKHTRSEEGSVDAVVDTDSGNGDAYYEMLDIDLVKMQMGVKDEKGNNVPRGICTMLYRLSTPSSELPLTGTPITGRAV